MSLREKVLAIVACLLWSTAFASVKVGLNYFPPLALAGLRFFLAGLMLLPFAGGMHVLGSALSVHRRAVFLTATFNTIGLYALYFMAMRLTRGAQAAIMIGSSPLVAAVCAHFLLKNDRMTLYKTGSLVIGFSGIVLISVVGKPWERVGVGESLGLGLLLCASTVGAIGNIVVVRVRSPSLHPIALASLQMLIGGSVLFCVSVILNGVPAFRQPVAFYGVLLWLSFISAAAFAIWFRLLQRVKVSALNLWKFLIPIFGAVVSWGLLEGESPEWLSLGGMVLVAGGIVCYNRCVSRER